jgi:hypothetical protein
MGETRVDLLHLLEDLADAYPGDVEETILTEVVANSLDSGATTIAFSTDTGRATLTVIDDGTGMRRAQLRRFHDIAASTKERGDGIGFAGIGIKLGLLVSEDVTTESRRGKDHVATSWALANRKRAVWRWVTPAGLVGERGTAVQLRLQNPLSPLLDAGLVEGTLRRHFEPLLDPRFDEILRAHYPRGVRFSLNGRELDRRAGSDGEVAPVSVHLARKRKPAAWGWVQRHAHEIPEGQRGIAVSTFGKVIKRGWDWLGLAPATPDRVGGLIEAPGLAASLTLNKADFLRTGPRGAVYLSYRKALQEAVQQQFAAWGDSHGLQETARRRAARPVERDVESVLVDLADRFPLLATLVERRTGGQRKLRMGRPDGEGEPLLLPPEDASGAPVVESAEPPPEMPGAGAPEPAASSGASAEVPPEREPAPEPPGTVLPSPLQLPTRKGRKQPARLTLSIQFEARPDDPELGRLVESTVWVNNAHPGYVRAVESRAESYHIALAVAMALARVVVEPVQEHGFVSMFLSRWGEAGGAGRGKRRR